MALTSIRTRWAAIGAAVAVSIGAAGGVSLYANAASSDPSSFVGITPCRLFDTRVAPDNVGDRSTPLTTGETLTRQVRGANGACTIPAGAIAISYNLTVPDPTVTGFIKVFPGDAAAPNASAINPVAGQGTKANSGIVGLGAAGDIKLFNQTGPVDALFDITGYFLPTSAGPAGPRGASAWDLIPSGQTVTGNFGTTTFSNRTTAFIEISVSLPGRAPVALTASDVNFNVDGNALTIDDDAGCTGTAAAPTAPAGKLCLYLYGASGFADMAGSGAQNLGDRAFYISGTVAAPTDLQVFLTWAYTAP